MCEELGVARKQWGWTEIIPSDSDRGGGGGGEGAAVLNSARSPTSRRYSCTKQNKLPIPALQYVFQQASPERDSSFAAYGPVECAQDEGRGREKDFLHRQKRGEITDSSLLRCSLVMQKETGKRSYSFVFRQFGERHFLPSNNSCAMAEHQGILAAERGRGGEMLCWSCQCWLVHLQHGVSGRW